MSNLARAANERISRIARRPDVPDWHRPVSYVLLAAFFVYLGVAALSAPPRSSESPMAQAPSPQPPREAVVAVPGDLTVAGGGAGSGDAPPQDALQDAPQEPLLPPVDAAVPQEALLVAQQAAVALFSGDFSQVPTSPATRVPSGLTVFEGTRVLSVALESYSQARVVLTFIVDPDGDGGEIPRPVTLAVELLGGAWVFAGFGF